MIRVNLLPLKEAQRALGRRRQLSGVLLCVSVVLLAMVIPFVLQGRHMAGLERESDQLTAEVAKLDEQVREVQDLDKRRAELQAKLKVVEDLKQKRIGPVHMLEDLGTAAPEKLWLVDFADANNQATITGLALDNQTIAAFMRRLQTSKYFYNVDLVETAQSPPVKGPLGGDLGMIFKKFIVKAQLDYLGKGGKVQAAPPKGRQPVQPKTGA